MKKVFSILTIILSSVVCYAQSAGGNSQSNPPTGRPSASISFSSKPGIKVGARPKAPSMQSIECVYEDGMLYFTFNYSEGASMLYIYDSTQTTMLGQHQLYTDFESAVYVGDLNDVYLCIVTSYGNEYEGWLY